MYMQYVHELPDRERIKLTVTPFIITLGRSVTLVDLRIVLSTPFGPFSSRDDGCGGVHQETILSVGHKITMCFDSFIISSHCLSIYLFLPVGILWWLVSTSLPPLRQSWSIHSFFWACTSAYDTRGRSWDRCWTMLWGCHNCRHWRTVLCRILCSIRCWLRG